MNKIPLVDILKGLTMEIPQGPTKLSENTCIFTVAPKGTPPEDYWIRYIDKRSQLIIIEWRTGKTFWLYGADDGYELLHRHDATITNHYPTPSEAAEEAIKLFNDIADGSLANTAIDRYKGREAHHS